MTSNTPTPARPALDAMAEEIERLCEAATPGDLATAEGGARDQEDVECPACNGEGSISATDYCNFDGAATGVQFFGIGKEFGAHEALWRFFMANRKDICAALRSLADMRGACEEALAFMEDENITGSLPDQLREALARSAP